MALKYKGLPSRFPVGTKFVIERRPGAAGQVSRHLEFPDGTLFKLPGRAAQPRQAKKPRRHRDLRDRDVRARAY
jgi:hypothetical protein